MTIKENDYIKEKLINNCNIIVIFRIQFLRTSDHIKFIISQVYRKFAVSISIFFTQLIQIHILLQKNISRISKSVALLMLLQSQQFILTVTSADLYLL